MLPPPRGHTRRRHRVAPGLFDPWDHPCRPPQGFMAAVLWFPIVHLPLAGTTVDAPPSLAAVACKTSLSKNSFHPSLLKNPFKFWRFSRTKRVGGFASDVGRFGKTTLPCFRSALTTEQPGGGEEAHRRWPVGRSELGASKAKQRPPSPIAW